MDVSYQHANPGSGNESYLIRVDEEWEDGTPCILVDAGDGVDLDRLLDADDYIAAVLLTHAHVDHYRSLGAAHRDAAPIITSPDTAAILEDVFAEGTRHYGLENVASLRRHVEPVAEWYDIIKNKISVRPIPVGHTPGASGFLIRIRDGSESFQALATGDFTLRDAAGYPGFDPTAYLDVDAVFLTAATVEDTTDTLSDILTTLVERVNAGSPTLCTASGLTGVHLAVLLASVGEELDYSVPIVLAGQIAKLYDALEYDHDAVTTVPEFADPTECLDQGTVTIAGPEVPVEGSSQHLFEAMKHDGNATLVQVRGGSTTPKTAGDIAGTVYAFRFSNHPPESALDDVVETISPVHVVLEHQSGHSLDTYKDKWDAFTWANQDDHEEILYRDGRCRAPPWVGEYAARRVRNRDRQTNPAGVDDAVIEAAMALPEFARRDAIDLKAEGIDVDSLTDALHVSPTMTASDATTTATEAPTASGSTGDTSSEPTTAAGTGSESPRLTDGGLFRTVGMDTSEDGSIDLKKTAVESDSKSGLIDTIQYPLLSESGAGTRREESVEASGSVSQQKSGVVPDETGKEDGTNTLSESESTDVEQQDEHEDSEETMTTETEHVDEGEIEGDAQESVSPKPDSDTETVDVDPVVRALAVRRVKADGSTMTRFVEEAVESYLSATLRGDTPWNDATVETEPSSALHVDAEPALDSLLSALSEDAGADDVSSFLLETVCNVHEVDLDDRTVPVPNEDSMTTLVEALVENNNCPHETRADVVQAALQLTLLD